MLTGLGLRRGKSVVTMAPRHRSFLHRSASCPQIFMRLILVRHYKTLVNVDDCILGWGDAPRAPDWEADLLYLEAILHAQNLHIDAVYSSGLERSRATARYYARRRALHLIRDSAALNEVNYGQLYRQPKQWVAQQVPQYKTDAEYIFPGGESFRQMQQRSVDFVTALEAIHANQTLLLVIHAGVIRGLLCHFLNLELTPHLKRKISHRYLGDMTLSQGRCIRYQELGVASGFMRSGVLATLPASAPSICNLDS